MSGLSSPTQRVKELGRHAGFDLVRIAPATQLHAARARYLEWIDNGRQGGMGWITPARAERSSNPSSVLPDAQSVICVALAYGGRPDASAGPNRGRVARYAWGKDYHAVLGQRLDAFAGVLRAEFGGEHRWYVDTGPLMDKALAERAGLGWYGKNTNILSEAFGSFVLLGEIVTTLVLEADQQLDRGCGSCRLCVVACPTGALGPEYAIESRRCISYLTIEHRDAIPRDLRAAIGGWVFGCDICQDVCPPSVLPHLTAFERRNWAEETRRSVRLAAKQAPREHEPMAPRSSGVGNTDRQRRGPDGEVVITAVAQAEAHDHPLFSAGTRPSVDLVWLLQLSHADYIEAFRGTAIRRAKVWMLRRNAAVALGNIGEEIAAPALRRAMCEDEHPIVRGHAAWALAQIARRCAIPGIAGWLQEALLGEPEPEVRNEIVEALRDAALAAVKSSHPG